MRGWIQVFAIVTPLACLAGALTMLLTIYADTCRTSLELSRRVAVATVETPAERHPDDSMRFASEDAPETTDIALQIEALDPVNIGELSERAGALSRVGEYTMRRRDNLWMVVKRECGLTGDLIAPAVEYVRRLNGITNVRRMQPGDRILLPSRDELMKLAGAVSAPEPPQQERG